MVEHSMELCSPGEINHSFSIASNSSCLVDVCQAYSAPGSAKLTLTQEAASILTYLYVSLTAVMSVLSVIGSALILYYYYKMPSLRNKSRQLLVYLSVCDIFIALGNLVGITWIKLFRSEHADKYKMVQVGVGDWGTVDQLWICKIQAVVCTGFSIASFLWTSFIAINVFLTVVYNNKKLAVRYQWLLHSVCWGVPILVATVVLIHDRFGYNPCLDLIWWCWIKPLPSDQTTKDVIAWQLFGGKIWEIASYILVLVLYSMVKVKLKRHVNMMESSLRPFHSSGVVPYTASESSAYINANKKLTYIPLVFIVARIWGTARFLLGVSDPYAKFIGAYIAPLQRQTGCGEEHNPSSSEDDESDHNEIN